MIKNSDILPYETIEEALKANIIYTNSDLVKMKRPNQLSKWDATCSKSLVIIKVLKTIENNWEIVREKYNVQYLSKMFWLDSTFQIIDNQNNFMIEVITGMHLPYYTDRNNVSCYNMRCNISNYVYSCFNKLEMELTSELPKNQKEMVLCNLNSIAEMTRCY